MTSVQQLPPPIPQPWWKNTFQLANSLMDYMVEHSGKNGEISTIKLGFINLYLTAHPDWARHILQTNHRNYTKNEGYEPLKLLVGNGLVTSEGSFWKRQRRLAQPAFHRRRLQELFDIMVEVTQEFIDYLETKRGKTIQLQRKMMDITLDVVARTLFSSTLTKADLDEVHRTLGDLLEYVAQLGTLPFLKPIYQLTGKHRKFAKGVERLDNIVYRIIEERRNDPREYSDLLQMLMDAQDEETGERMTDQQLRDEIMTLFLAGHETSATALTWTWYLLDRHPDIREKLLSESNEVLGDRMPEFADLPKLDYTRQVIEESMRLYPPIWVVGRQNIADDKLNGYFLPEKSNVALCIYSLHRDPDIWEKPNKFIPERFESDKVKARHKAAYIPFVIGPRMCIGNRFALMEMQLIVATLVTRFRFKVKKPKKVQMEGKATLRPKGGIKVKVK